MRRLAWFTPLPPTRSGIAAYNAALLPGLAQLAQIDVFTAPLAPPGLVKTAGVRAGMPPAYSAHDFVWKHRRSPYDLVVYQLGNAACHDFVWPHLPRFPGLVVLHDGNLHLERSRALLTRQRLDDYRAEFRYNHPDAPEGIPELVITTLAGNLYYLYPMLRWVVGTARLVAVHSAGLAERLRTDHPGMQVETIRLGVEDPGMSDGGQAMRQRLGIPPDGVVFAAFGLVTPEKRISACLRALAALAPQQPSARLLLAGGTTPYYDVLAEARALGVADKVHLTGYVADEDLPACLAAADICLGLRWPTGGETSAAWLNALAAGKPTVVTDLAQTADVPSLDPLTWQVRTTAFSGTSREPAARNGDTAPSSRVAAVPVCVSVNMLDEDRSLLAAMTRLAADAGLREALGRAGRAHWRAHHTMEGAVADYGRVIEQALRQPIPRMRDLPAHLLADHTGLARRLAAEMGASLDLFE